MNNELTYTQLMNQAKFIGSCLSLKIKPTQGVPVYMDKTCNTLSLFMGIVYAGGYYCMLDTTHPAERINLILDTIQADILVADNKSAKKAEKLGFQGEIINLDELLEEYDGQAVDSEAQERLGKIREQALDTDPLYSIFTSGSTGVPKGVIVNHRSTIDFIDCFTETFGITNEDVIGNQAPFDFDVSVKDIYSSLKTGATLQLIPKMCFSFPTKLLDFLDDRKVTTIIWAVSALCIITTLKGFDYNGAAVPAMIAQLLNRPFVNACVGLEVNGAEATAVREIEGGKETLTVKLPAVIAGQKGMVEEKDLIIPNMRGIMSARTKPLTVKEPTETDVKVSAVSFDAVPARAQVKLVSADNLDELVRLLHEEAKVI
jgi:acyl-CoA synthetase (AMP-forming)/AMP-acid ligase II